MRETGLLMKKAQAFQPVNYDSLSKAAKGHVSSSLAPNGFENIPASVQSQASHCKRDC